MPSLIIWTAQSGESLGTLQERITIEPLRLPVIFNDFEISYSIISGSLPDGLRLENEYIVGTPYEVPRTTTFTFCIRATKNYIVSDRTFSLTIEGADAPTILTTAGPLPVGIHQQYYVMDNSLVDFQINAYDTDTATGQTLTYFIASDDGALPPGVRLTEDGRIIGFVTPINITDTNDDGRYDTDRYDTASFDSASTISNGFDSYPFDSNIYDFSLPGQRPTVINRNYEFTVTVTDGDSIVKKTFQIYVVNDDYFRADNTDLISHVGLYTADITYLREPVWITKSFLGVYRANNYIFVRLDVYDLDLIYYSIDDVNNLPPGMNFDVVTGEIYGSVPYQPAISKNYTFSVTASRHGDPDKDDIISSTREFTITIIGELDSAITWITPSDLGSITANYVSTLKVTAESSIPGATVLHQIVSGNFPPGLTLSLDGEITGKVNQYADSNQLGLMNLIDEYSGPTIFDNGTTTFDRVFKFTVKATDQTVFTTNQRTFALTVIPDDRLYSNVSARPYMTTENRATWKEFIDDPTIFTPSSIYRPNDSNFGLRSDLSMTIYAGIETTDAEKYISAIALNHKRKRFKFGSISKAIAKASIDSDTLYEVVYINMIDELEPNDKVLPNKITRSTASSVISVDTNNSIWSSTIEDLSIPAPDNRRPEYIITVDSTGYQTSNPSINTYYPNSITNWRFRLSEVGETMYNYLPTWMRTIQPGSRIPLGFTLAVPLCFCKIGTADDIILNIKHSNFNFNLLDYTIDRFVIDRVSGNNNDKYLIFKNDRITL